MGDIPALLTEAEAHWIWAIVAFALSIIEIVTLTLFLIPFMAAALCLAVITYLFPGMGGEYQIVSYVLVSTVFFVLFKSKIRSFGQPKTDSPNLNRRVDRLVGQTVVSQGVLSLQSPVGSAQSRDDTLWQVRLIEANTPNDTIPAGTSLQVTAVEGATLLVKASA